MDSGDLMTFPPGLVDVAPASEGKAPGQRHQGARSAIWAIGTAVPGNGMAQSELADFMKRAHRADAHLARRLEVLYRRSGIDRRYSCLVGDGTVSEALAFYPQGAMESPPPSTAQRMKVYREAAASLAEEAVWAAIQKLPGLDAKRITHLIVTSCTGFHAPGLDVELANRVGLSPHVARTMVGFQGCHAGLAGLRLADATCCANPQSTVLLVCVELCTLHFQSEPSDENLIANSLFGDGACAVLVAADPPAPRLDASAAGRVSDVDDAGASGGVTGGGVTGGGVTGGSRGSRLTILRSGSWLKPDTAGEMAWSVGDHGFQMGLSALVPRLLEQDIASFLRQAIAIEGSGLRELSFWAVHPGGPAILDRVARALALDRHLLAPSRSVLREFGNMSSPTVFFVLERIWDEIWEESRASTMRRATGGLTTDGRQPDPGSAAAPSRRGVALAFGPGLTLEAVLLEARD